MAAREYTNRLYDLMVEGVVDAHWVANALMNYMSEADIKDFCTAELEDLFEQDEDTADEYEPDVDFAQEYDEGYEYYGA